MYTEILVPFCSLLGIGIEEVKKHEMPERLTLSFDVAVQKIKALTEIDIERMLDTFGHSLEITIGAEDAQPILSLQHGEISNEKNTLEEFLRLPDSMILRVQLQIQKEVILQEKGINRENVHGLFFLFLDNFTKLLNSALDDLDQQLFNDSHTPTLVFIADSDLIYSGEFLTILGGENIQMASQYIRQPPKRTTERVNDYFRIASDNLNWVGFNLHRLTPLHFLCEAKFGEVENLTKLLAKKLLQLFIAFTANRSMLKELEINAFYASSENTVEITTTDRLIPSENFNDLLRLTIWLQSSYPSEKLYIIQNTIAREIAEADGQKNYTILLSRLSRILQDVRWQFRVYLDGKITKHFEKVQEVYRYVEVFSGKISDNLDTLAKSFVDTLLASVGVIILTLIASLVENKVQDVIFRTGMWVYAAYLLLFQVIYRMGYIYYGFRLIVKEAMSQLTPYELALGKSKVDNLTVFYFKRKRFFQGVFWVTFGLYIAFIIAIVISGALMPSMLSHLISTQATQAPTQLVP